MKQYCYVLVLLLVAGCSRPASNVNQREFTDMSGRIVLLPEKISSIYCPSPMGTAAVYTFDADLLAGWNYPLNENEGLLIPKRYHRLPALGGWFGKSAGANVEQIMKTHPDCILSVATDSAQFDSDKALSLGKKTGIPSVVLYLRSIDEIPALYRSLGILCGDTVRGNELAEYSQMIIERAKKIAALVPEKSSARIYYAEGLKGLNTESEQSMHAQTISFCGLHNVAKISENGISGYGNTPVSIEQVVAWNPEIILISDYLGKDGGIGGWKSIIAANPLWMKIKAVQKGRVYVIPHTPFQWIDRPPSVNRLAGLIWLPALAYPQYCTYSLAEEIKKFYKTFYHYELTSQELESLLASRIN